MNRELLTPEELGALLANDEDADTVAPRTVAAGDDGGWRLTERRLLARIHELSETVMKLTVKVHALEQELLAQRTASSFYAATAESAAVLPNSAKDVAAALQPGLPLPEPITVSRSERHKTGRKKWFR